MDGVVVEDEMVEVNKNQDEVDTEKETKIAQDEYFPCPSDDSY